MQSKKALAKVEYFDQQQVLNSPPFYKQKQPGAVNKGVAKQSRIKNIVWHLRWLVRTRADICLWQGGLIRPRTDIKLCPSALVRTRTDTKLRTRGLVRSYKDCWKSKYTCKSF